jgi:sigma-B regulation protein RsbQ
MITAYTRPAAQPDTSADRIVRRNNVHISGRGTQPMIFAHGFGCDQTMWRHIAHAFEDNYRVILFDYVGSGKSDHTRYNPMRYGSLEGYAQDILEICEALQLRDVIFVGHSVSAMIGMIAAKDSPQLFKAMVMACPNACYVNEPGYEGGFDKDELEALVMTIGAGKGWTKALAPAVMGNPERPQLARELEALFCEMNPDVARDFARITFLSDHRPLISQHKTPTLVLQTAEDIVAPVSAGEFIRRYMQSSTLVQMKATGHVPQASAPQETISAMWNYLSTARV